MAQRWLIVTLGLCGLLILTTIVFSTRGKKDERIVELDGRRIYRYQTMGFIPSQRTEPDLTLTVSLDLMKELGKRKVKLSGLMDRYLSETTRTRHPSGRTMYFISGEVKESARDVIDFYARQMPRAHRWTSGRNDQLSYVWSPGRTNFSVFADASASKTWVSINFEIAP